MSLNLVKKITVKSCIGDIMGMFPVYPVFDEAGKPAGKKPKLGDKVMLLRVMGVSDGVKRGSTNFGDWTGFTGQFKAIVLDSGEEYRSKTIILPDTGTDYLEPAVMEHGGDGGVKFAFDLGAKVVEDRAVKGAFKYEFIVSPLVELAENDTLAQFDSILPALPAPNAKALAAPDAGNVVDVESKEVVTETVGAPQGAAETSTEAAAGKAPAAGKKK